jgi:chromosome segregation ATPase
MQASLRSGQALPCDNDVVGPTVAAEHLAHAAALERRDAAVARELDVVRALAERAAAVRGRAGEIRTKLERIPADLAELEARRVETEAAGARAQTELEAAEARVAELERGRRRRPDELERARSETRAARALLADTESQLARIDGQTADLRAEEEALHREARELSHHATTLAAEVRGVTRVTESAGNEPGDDLGDVEECGARARAALFVARGTLETERERIVLEANALGTAVLGESLGASSVAVVRRRLEDRLG